ncbi:MAG: autotransporter domain-containing protein [Pseudolabrys sp.]|nr:autotransporter domain-containing protein [Pseudolabrys sp.]
MRAVLLASTALSLAAILPAAAQDATWLASPGTADFNTGANWSTGAVPTGTASFDTSSQTALTFSADASFDGWTFNAGASAYTFANNHVLTFNSAGIVINGGSATITNDAFGALWFNNTSTADGATITNNGLLGFSSSSTAGSAAIANSSTVHFLNTSTAGSATITNNTSGFLTFSNASTGGSAAITNSGVLTFFNTSTAGSAAITNNAGGTVDISFSTGPAGDGKLSAGSIAGAGLFYLGSRQFTVGSNNLSTTVSGVISDCGAGGVACSVAGATGGSLVKTGTGTLTLTGANTYTGGTTVDGGTLNIGTAGTTGSIVGAVAVNAFNTLNFVNADISGITGITTAGFTIFREGQSAGNLSITTSGFGQVSFFGGNSADTATLVNNSSSGAIGFGGDSTAGNATITNNAGSLVFFSTSTAGNAIIALTGGSATFLQTTTAGSASITISTGSDAAFTGSSTAGNATIVSSGGLFFDSTSSAGNATITNNGTFNLSGTSTAASATIANNGNLDFFNTSTAANASVNNSATGNLFFWDTSTAGNAAFTNGGNIYFSQTSSAATATFNNSGTINLYDTSTAGSAAIVTNSFGSLIFNGTSTAGSATITNNGNLDFFNTSTGGNAAITNNLGGTTSFWNTTTAGGASISNAGTVSFNGTSTAGSATITNANTGHVTFNGTSTASNATMSGTGSIFFNGTSTAANATITSNNLSFSNSSTAGSSTITANFQLQFFNTSTAGSATITNNSVMNFLDTSTAGDATITNNGFLRFYGSSTGGPARLINSAGATIDLSVLTAAGTAAGSIEGAGTVALGSKNLEAGGNNLSRTFSGVLQDGGFGGGSGGSLTKTGTGTLTLSGNSTYTGATTINGGTLAVNGSILASSGITVNSGGALGGTGTVANTIIASGGALAPGNSIGTITINGNLTFNAGGIYTVEVSPTDADRTNVTGTATLTGATVQAVALPGSFRAQTYTILNATGGLGGTQFAGLNVTGSSLSPGARNPHLTYDANKVYLVLDPGMIQLPAGAGGNQASVAGGINKAVEGGATPPSGFDTLLNMTGSQLTSALNQISGQPATGGATSATQMMTSFLALLTNPNPGGGTTTGRARSFASAPATSPEAAAAYAAVTPRDKTLAAFAQPRWSVWSQIYGGYDKTTGDTADTTARTWGLATGFDYRAASDLTLGFALAGGSMNWAWSQGLGGGKSDVLQIGAFGRKEFGPAYVAGALSYAWHSMSTDRTVTVSGTDKLTASFDAHSFGGRLETGYRFATRWLGMTPYAALQMQSFRTPSYSESAASGSNAFALTYEARSTTSTRTELGVWFDKTITLDSGNTLALRSRAAWAHDYSDNTAQGALFQTLSGSNFTVNGAQSAPNAFLISVGADYGFGQGWSVATNIDGEFSRTTTAYAAKAMVRYAW